MDVAVDARLNANAAGIQAWVRRWAGANGQLASDAMHLMVVRHAQPIDETNTDGVGDPPLSPLGLSQAEAICSFLSGEQVDHIVASPMARAHQTAEPLARRLGMEIELVDDLKEAGYDAGPYRRAEENMGLYIEKMNSDPEFLYRPEGRDSFVDRTTKAFDRIIAANAGRRVAVFCHGMVTTELVGRVIGVDRPDPRHLHVGYASLTRILASAKRTRLSLMSFNETMHLR